MTQQQIVALNNLEKALKTIPNSRSQKKQIKLAKQESMYPIVQHHNLQSSDRNFNIPFPPQKWEKREGFTGSSMYAPRLLFGYMRKKSTKLR